jgi:hypothetical protein
MKEYWSKFWKKYKVGIIGGVVVGVSVSAIYLLTRNPNLRDMTGKAFIAWKPDGNTFMSLERVKEILELNKDTSGQFAIFREGPDPSKYICIVLNDMVEF